MSAHPVFEQMFAKFFGAPAPRIPEPMRPDALDVIDMNNESINEIRDSAERAEETGELPRMDYGPKHEERNDERR